MKFYLAWVTSLFCLLLCLCGGRSAAVAQKASAQRTVAVVVADAHTEPAQPVPTVRISLGYLDGSVLVTEARDVTNPKGQAWLDVSEDAAQRGGLRIQIDGASGLVIYQPADGQLSALPTTISVSMLPKGSPALLGPAQIQAMLHRMSLQISSSAEEECRALRAGESRASEFGAGERSSGAETGPRRRGCGVGTDQWLLRRASQSAGPAVGRGDPEAIGRGNGRAKGAGGACAQSLLQRRSIV